MNLYMILKKHDKNFMYNPNIQHNDSTTYSSYYTHSLEDVADALKHAGVEVYKFGELCRIMDVEVTYQEKPQELT